MSKYSKEFKLEVTKYYLEEHHTYSECCKKFNIPSMTPIKQWVDSYQLYGVKGFIKNSRLSYDGNFKQNVVEYMHANHLSATETSIRFKIQTYVVLKWERIYYEEGPQALYIDRRGRPNKMSSKKPEKNKTDKNNEEDLIKEVQSLRMENEYLKKLNALVQERVKRENKKK